MVDNASVDRYEKDLKEIDLRPFERAIFNHELLELFMAFHRIVEKELKGQEFGSIIFQYWKYLRDKITTLVHFFEMSREK